MTCQIIKELNNMDNSRLSELNNEVEIQEERIRTILEALPDLIFILSEAGIIVDCIKSLQQEDIIASGIAPGSRLADVFNLNIADAILKTLHDARLSGKVLINEYCLRPECQLYIEVRLIPLSDGFYMVIARNISERFQVQAALKESESLYRTIFETTGTASFIASMDTTIIMANQKFSQLSGYTIEELLNEMSIRNFFVPDDLPLIYKYNYDLRFPGEHVNDSCEARFVDRWGRIKHCIVYGSIIPGTDKSVASLVDITSRREYEEKITYYSFHDSLTGLYNRRFFEEELKRLDTVRNFPLTLILCDVNGMKLHNDTFGHLAGDKLLKKTAEIIKRGCRNDEIIARIGGDEFAIVLSGTGTEETGQIVKRLQNLISTERINDIPLSISFGWASKTKITESLDEIFKLAENMMYKHKLYNYPSIHTDNLNSILEIVYEKFPGEKEHSEQVAEISELMGKGLGFNQRQLKEIRAISLLHDIGKVTLSGVNLFKPGKLDEIEWIELKRHPEVGYRILSSNNEVGKLAEYILTHHENWDGSGYPGGLKGEEIPLPARIVRIADAYVAMTNNRCYRNALSREQVIGELRNNAGVQFDPFLVEVFLNETLPQLP